MEGSKEVQSEEPITAINNHSSPLLAPGRPSLCSVVRVCQQPPLQLRWHRGTGAVKIKLSGGKHPRSIIAETEGEGGGGMKE